MKYLMALLIAVCLLGCDINPSKFGAGEARSFAQKITYVKDERTGVCFALVASRKTGVASQSGMGMSVVPCIKVTNYLER